MVHEHHVHKWKNQLKAWSHKTGSSQVPRRNKAAWAGQACFKTGTEVTGSEDILPSVSSFSVEILPRYIKYKILFEKI